MQPDSPSPVFSSSSTNSINPDFSFLNQPSKRRLKLPLGSGSLRSRIIIGIIGFILVVIIIVILSSLFSTSPFSKSDYLTVLERQQEMYHILTTDITSANSNQLSSGDQDFASTAQLTLSTALSRTLSYTSSYGYKISSTKLANVYSRSIDSGFSSALESNNLGSYFHATMESQLSSYEQELSSAYNSTNNNSGRYLLKAEYSEAQLLTKALVSPAS